MNALSPLNSNQIATPVAVEAIVPVVTRKDLPPQMQRVATALRDYVTAIDIEIHTTAANAVEDLFATMPVIPGHEDDMLLLMRAIAGDIRTAFQDSSQPMLLRFVNQDNEDKIIDVAPLGTSHIVVVPVETSTSLHATPQNVVVTESMDQVVSDMRRKGEMHNEWFVVVADPSAKLPPAALQGECVQVRQPLDAKQVENYVEIIRTIQVMNQVMADSMLSMGAGAMLGQLNAYTGTILPMLKNTGNDAARISAVQASRLIHQSAQQIERQLKEQIINRQIPAVTREVLRAGLQQIREVQNKMGIASPNVKSRVVMRPQPLVSGAPVQGTVANPVFAQAFVSPSVNMPPIGASANAVPINATPVKVVPVTAVQRTSTSVMIGISAAANNIVPITVAKTVQPAAKAEYVPGIIPIFGNATLQQAPQAQQTVQQVMQPVLAVVAHTTVPTAAPTAAVTQPNSTANASVATASPVVQGNAAAIADVQTHLERTPPVHQNGDNKISSSYEVSKNGDDRFDNRRPRDIGRDSDEAKKPSIVLLNDERKQNSTGSPLNINNIGGGFGHGQEGMSTKKIISDFHRAKDGACAHCSGGNCSACRPKVDLSAITQMVAALKK